MTGIEKLWEAADIVERDGRFYIKITFGTRLKEIADQIERETERTCHMTKKGQEFILEGWWQCSECGIVYPPCNEEIARWALQYCPRCGAKVVEE